MRKTVKGRQTEIRWQFTNKLEDLDFANDIAFIASKKVDMQRKVINLNINGEKTGQKINQGKLEGMKLTLTWKLESN